MDAPLSVKRLLEQIKAKVEPAFSAVCVLGEVSNFRGSGRHWYFTLKEDGAALQCAVWAGQQRFLKHTPADGDRVVVKGSLNLYVAGGTITLPALTEEFREAGVRVAHLDGTTPIPERDQILVDLYTGKLEMVCNVGVLTEGWDCTTVTHIIGLRPFMSQLLCEQVVGRGLRRSSYVDFDEEGKLHEEVSKILNTAIDTGLAAVANSITEMI